MLLEEPSLTAEVKGWNLGQSPEETDPNPSARDWHFADHKKHQLSLVKRQQDNDHGVFFHRSSFDCNDATKEPLTI